MSGISGGKADKRHAGFKLSATFFPAKRKSFPPFRTKAIICSLPPSALLRLRVMLPRCHLSFG